jgi:hypothetical protein
MGDTVGRIAFAALAIASGLAGLPAFAQAPADAPATSDEAPSAEDLAKRLSNPVASLISVPFQNNTEFGWGPDDGGVRNALNVQPVIPISLGAEWNLISRTILPVIWQDEDVVPGTGDEFGLGDTLQSLFLSPVEPGPAGLIWGVGPVLLLDTATEDVFGADQWGAGPTFVVLRQDAGWTYGMLANHIWSFAGDEGRSDVDATFLQPFLSHTWKSGTTLTLNTESTYDWEGEQWTVPLLLGVSQVLRVGGQMISLQLGGRWFAERPDGGPDWGVRFVLTLLFPR